MSAIYKFISALGLYSLMGTILVTSSCKKLVNVSAPVTSTNAENVFTSDATAIAAVTGVYAKISSSGTYLTSGQSGLSVLAGLSADELTLYSGVSTGTLKLYYTNTLNNTTANFWSGIYPLVYTVNASIQGLSGSNGLTPVVKQQLLGESKFLRAFFYFYLVNLYGDVPLILGTDYTINASSNRTPQAQVWQQIIVDLKDAQGLLSNNFLGSTLLNTTTSRIRPTKWAATALLSRAYLYTKDWADAKSQTDSLILSSAPFTLALVTPLKNTFLLNSNEAIWQLQPVSTSPTNTYDGATFVLPATGPNTGGTPVFLSTNLLSAFEPNDQRRLIWVDSVKAGGILYYFPYKYEAGQSNTTLTEYFMMLRLGEQYLIRAEAEANGANGGATAAIADLNVIRNRAGLPNYSGGNDQSSLMKAIVHERQVELFTEMGQRWLDLKRANIVDSVMGIVSPQKGGSWSSNWQWYPIPLTELTSDSKLIQNVGY